MSNIELKLDDRKMLEFVRAVAADYVNDLSRSAGGVFKFDLVPNPKGVDIRVTKDERVVGRVIVARRPDGVIPFVTADRTTPVTTPSNDADLLQRAVKKHLPSFMSQGLVALELRI